MQKRMSREGLCSERDCDRPIRCRGLCGRHYGIVWRAKNAHYQAEWRRRNIEKAKAAEARARAKRSPASRAHAREYMRSYNAQHRERINAWVREWNTRNTDRKVQNNRERRARLKGNGVYAISAKDMRRLMNRRECEHCGGGFTRDNPRNIDHRIPVIRGGRHAVGNLWVLCRSCNFRKHASFYSEWRYGRGSATPVAA
ncbi:HNH endonuclease [Nocardia brasiliensis]|uniref:HNH endonuclease n=1 Tax=Nocardia brasiliensis TaxID=37326 RepID=UPI003D7ADD15